MNDHILMSETRQFRTVFPEMLNANETLFGGKAMQWMDEIAYITATRFTHQRIFTVKVEEIKFLNPVKSDMFIELIGRVTKAGAVKLEISVEIFAEKMYDSGREKVMEATFIMASLDENNRPKRICYDHLTAELTQ